jgi:hypothetical protein
VLERRSTVSNTFGSIWAKRSTTLRTPNSGAQLDHVAPMLAQPRKAATVSGMFGR